MLAWPDGIREVLRDGYAVASAFDGGGDPGEHLYRHWYARPVGPVEDLGPWAAPVAGVCRAAHAAARRWSTRPVPVLGAGFAGVAVVGADGGRRRAVTRGEYVTDTGSPGLAPGTATTLRVVAREGGHVAEGWWRTWSHGWEGQRTLEAGVSRVYLAPVAREVGRLVHAVTRVLEAQGCDWAFKVGVDVATLARGDGAVVYVPDRALEPVVEALAGAARPFVRDGYPPLTARLAPGIAWAQDPGDGDSFGERTCDLLARAVSAGDRRDNPHDADAGSPDDLDAFLERLAAVYRAAGLDPGAPHLRARHRLGVPR